MKFGDIAQARTGSTFFVCSSMMFSNFDPDNILTCRVHLARPEDHRVLFIEMDQPVHGFILPTTLTWHKRENFTRIGTVTAEVIEQVHRTITAITSPT